MIINFIVAGSLLLGGIYCVLWLARKDVRDKIEEPKYRFQENLIHYDNLQKASSNRSE